jgi:hypothetical protein
VHGVSDAEIVVPRSSNWDILLLFAGVMLTGIAAVIAFGKTPPWPAIGFFLVLGVPLLISSLRLVMRQPPVLRATRDGLWFGGGALVSWSEVNAIYESGVDVRSRGIAMKTSAIAFDFESRRTLFRLPIRMWIASPFGVGDVDVSPGNTRPSVLVAQLDAMRNVALGRAESV